MANLLVRVSVQPGGSMNASRAASARRTDPGGEGATQARRSVVPSRAAHAESKERAFPRREEEM